jgi:hypothetical protein
MKAGQGQSAGWQLPGSSSRQAPSPLWYSGICRPPNLPTCGQLQLPLHSTPDFPAAVRVCQAENWTSISAPGEPLWGQDGMVSKKLLRWQLEST